MLCSASVSSILSKHRKYSGLQGLTVSKLSVNNMNIFSLGRNSRKKSSKKKIY